MKLSKILNEEFKQALQRLINQPIPLKTAFKLRNTIEKIDYNLSQFDNVKNDGIKKYANKKDDTIQLNEEGNVVFTEENMKLLIQELNELSDMNIELESFSISEFGDKVLISTKDLEILRDIFKED